VTHISARLSAGGVAASGVTAASLLAILSASSQPQQFTVVDAGEELSYVHYIRLYAWAQPSSR
jgi:hypothetical protein